MKVEQFTIRNQISVFFGFANVFQVAKQAFFYVLTVANMEVETPGNLQNANELLPPLSSSKPWSTEVLEGAKLGVRHILSRLKNRAPTIEAIEMFTCSSEHVSCPILPISRFK